MHDQQQTTTHLRSRHMQQHAKVDQLLSNAEPLDAHEQQEVIAALEEQQVQQALTFRRVYAVTALGLAAFFAYAALDQQFHPWEARYTGELRPVTSAAAVVAVLALQSAALLAAALGLLVELPARGNHSSSRGCLPPAQQSRVLVGASLLAAGIGCFYWGSAMHHSIERYGRAVGAKWDLLWLPLGPLGYCALCWHLLDSLGRTSRELQQLRKLAYDFKKV